MNILCPIEVDEESAKCTISKVLILNTRTIMRNNVFKNCCKNSTLIRSQLRDDSQVLAIDSKNEVPSDIEMTDFSDSDDEVKHNRVYTVFNENKFDGKGISI